MIIFELQNAILYTSQSAVGSWLGCADITDTNCNPVKTRISSLQARWTIAREWHAVPWHSTVFSRGDFWNEETPLYPLLGKTVIERRSSLEERAISSLAEGYIILLIGFVKNGNLEFIMYLQYCDPFLQTPPTPFDILDPFNPLNPELNPICYLLALLAHHFLHVSRIRVKSLTLRLLISYIYGAPILDVSRSHTTTQHSR